MYVCMVCIIIVVFSPEDGGIHVRVFLFNSSKWYLILSTASPLHGADPDSRLSAQ